MFAFRNYILHFTFVVCTQLNTMIRNESHQPAVDDIHMPFLFNSSDKLHLFRATPKCTIPRNRQHFYFAGLKCKMYTRKHTAVNNKQTYKKNMYCLQMVQISKSQQLLPLYFSCWQVLRDWGRCAGYALRLYWLGLILLCVSYVC